MNRALSPRAVALGLLLGCGVCLVSDYSSFYLRNTLLIGNHLPLAALFVLTVLAVLINPGLRRWAPKLAFSSGEQIMIFSLMAVTGAFAETGLWRYLPSYMAAPAYYASAENNFGTYLMAHIRPSLLLGGGGSEAVRGYFEGLSSGQVTPWKAWALPLLAWFPFFAGYFLSCLSLAALMSRQWIDRERFVYPLALLPFEAARDPETGRFYGPLFRNKVFWLFFLAPVLLWGFNGLGSYVEGLPKIPTHWATYGLFRDRPWDQFHMHTANLYFTVVGVSFLLTREISFSIWFFFFLYRFSFVVIAALGWPANRFLGDWSSKIGAHQSAGVYLSLGFFSFYVARRHLASVWRSAFSVHDPTNGFSPKAALLVVSSCVLGPLLMFGWYLWAGLSWPFALGSVLLFLCILVVVTRLIAEAGLILLGTAASPFDSALGLSPAGQLDPNAAALLSVQKGALMEDYRQTLMPYLANGLKSGSLAGLAPQKIIPVFIFAMGLGFLASGLGVLGTSYRYGAANLDDWGAKAGPELFLGRAAAAVKAQQAPPPVRENAAHQGLGAAGSALLLFLRARLPWWPLHPYGWVICTTYATWMIWFSVFLGWLAKSLVMSLGGPSLYRRLVPGFMGLVLGEAVIGGLLAILALLSGRPGINILP